MADFSKIRLTDTGIKLINLSLAYNKPLIFTTCKLGSGVPESETPSSWDGFTDVIEPKLSAPMVKAILPTDGSGGQTALYFAVSNKSLTEGFRAREAGFYAKVDVSGVTDAAALGGYDGDEALAAYAYAGEYGDWIPDNGTPIDVEQYVAYLSLGNAENVSVEIAANTYALQADFAELEADVTEALEKVNEVIADNAPAVTGIDGVTPSGASGRGEVSLWDVLHRSDITIPPTNPTNSAWNALGLFSRYITELDTIKNQPTQYGQLLNIPATKDALEATQIWIAQNSGKLYVRGGNSSKILDDTAFTEVMDATNKLRIADNSEAHKGEAVSLANKVIKLPATITAAIVGNCTGSSGSCTGNAATATKLKTARTINGVSFDGTKNIELRDSAIASYSVSNANSWWIKFQGNPGLIIQGGYQWISDSTSITLPISFPTARLFATCITENNNGNVNNAASCTTTTATMFCDENGRNCYWMCMGY